MASLRRLVVIWLFRLWFATEAARATSPSNRQKHQQQEVPGEDVCAPSKKLSALERALQGIAADEGDGAAEGALGAAQANFSRILLNLG